jgi:hypothetical protein
LIGSTKPALKGFLRKGLAWLEVEAAEPKLVDLFMRESDDRHFGKY